MGPKTIIGPKQFWAKKIVGPKMILGPTIIFGLKKFGVQNMWVQWNFRSEKNDGSKQNYGKNLKKSGPKKLKLKKNCWLKRILDQKKI